MSGAPISDALDLHVSARERSPRRDRFLGRDQVAGTRPLEILALGAHHADVAIAGVLALDLLLSAQIGQDFRVGPARLHLAVRGVGRVGLGQCILGGACLVANNGFAPGLLAGKPVAGGFRRALRRLAIDRIAIRIRHAAAPRSRQAQILPRSGHCRRRRHYGAEARGTTRGPSVINPRGRWIVAVSPRIDTQVRLELPNTPETHFPPERYVGCMDPTRANDGRSVGDGLGIATARWGGNNWPHMPKTGV